MMFETRNGTCRYDGYEMVRVSAEQPPDSIWNALQTREAIWLREGQGRLARQGKDGSTRSWQLIPPDIIGYTHSDHFHVADVDERTEAITTYGNGLFLYDKPTGELAHIQKADRHSVLNDNYLTGLFVDRTGCIWVIEDYIGVNCLQLNNLQYTPLWLVPEAQIQDANHIRCIVPFGKDRLLLSNQMGDTYLYDCLTGQITFRQKDSFRIFTALVDQKGQEWIGTRGSGLWCDGRLIDGLPSRMIFNLREDDCGRIVVSMLEGGVAIATPDSTELLLEGKKVHDALVDKERRLWVAAEEGLYLLNTHGTVTDSVPGCFVCLLDNGDSTLWAGTTDRGLLQLSSENGKLVTKSLTRANGLASDGIYSLSHDHQGRLWMGTEEGLSMLDTRHDKVSNYKISESSLSNVFCERSAVCLDNGQLLFGTHNGIIMMTPPEDTPAILPQTTITGVMANGILIEDYSLSYEQDNLTFRFSSFLYAHQENVIFKYKLDNIDEDWSPSTIDHSVTYRSLPPGRYTFHVCSSSGGDVWGDETSISFTINQPWWNTWWAWLVYVLTLGFLGATAFLVVRRIMRLHQKLDVERKVAAFKMDFYSRIERELRNPVNVLQGAAENVQLSGTSKTTLQSLRRGSRRMLKLMDMIQQFNSLNTAPSLKGEGSEYTQDSEEIEQHFRDIQQAIHAEEQEYRELAPPPINEQTILILESDTDNLTHLNDTLSPFFRIVGCETLAACEDMITHQQPSALLIDITGDEKNCIELTRRLHKEKTSLPVIHLSSFSDDAHQLRSLRAGAADYITKPFSGKVLLERITRIIERSRDRKTGEDGKNSIAPSEAPVQQGLLTNPKDKKFLELFNALLSQHIHDENFSVEQFAELMHLGRTQFYKRVKELTGETPVQHLHRARLNYAAKLLSESQMTVEEIMIRAGFNSPTHFYNSFKKQFGMSPKELRNTKC